MLGAGGLVLALRRWRASPGSSPPTPTRSSSREERARVVTDERATDGGSEEEREFLLRSLDDLEAERAAGNIDDETYQRLHDDYTARAAIAVRAMRDGRTRGARRPRHRRRRAGTGSSSSAGSSCSRSVAATVMAFALGARLPGQTITGNRGAGAAGVVQRARRRALERAVARSPTDAEARLALARFRLGRRDLAGALRDVPGRGHARRRRTPSRSRTAAGSSGSRATPTRRLQLLDKAVTVDPSYPDAHFFRGYVLLQDKKNPERRDPGVPAVPCGRARLTARRPGAHSCSPQAVEAGK